MGKNSVCSRSAFYAFSGVLLLATTAVTGVPAVRAAAAPLTVGVSSDPAEASQTMDTMVRGLCRRAEALRAQGNLDGAMTLYLQALHVDDQDAEVYADLADVQVAKGQTSEALRSYRMSVGRQPGQGWSSSRMTEGDLELRYAIFLAQRKRFDEAATMYHEGRENLGDKERDMLPGKFFPRELEKSPELQKQFEATLHTALGLKYAADSATESARAERAAAQFRAALALTPDDGLAQWGLGSSLLRMGRRAEAQVVLGQAARSDNRDARRQAEEAILASSH